MSRFRGRPALEEQGVIYPHETIYLKRRSTGVGFFVHRMIRGQGTSIPLYHLTNIAMARPPGD